MSNAFVCSQQRLFEDDSDDELVMPPYKTPAPTPVHIEDILEDVFMPTPSPSNSDVSTVIEDSAFAALSDSELEEGEISRPDSISVSDADEYAAALSDSVDL